MLGSDALVKNGKGRPELRCDFSALSCQKSGLNTGSFTKLKNFEHSKVFQLAIETTLNKTEHLWPQSWNSQNLTTLNQLVFSLVLLCSQQKYLKFGAPQKSEADFSCAPAGFLASVQVPMGEVPCWHWKKHGFVYLSVFFQMFFVEFSKLEFKSLTCWKCACFVYRCLKADPRIMSMYVWGKYYCTFIYRYYTTHVKHRSYYWVFIDSSCGPSFEWLWVWC